MLLLFFDYNIIGSLLNLDFGPRTLDCRSKFPKGKLSKLWNKSDVPFFGLGLNKMYLSLLNDKKY